MGLTFNSSRLNPRPRRTFELYCVKREKGKGTLTLLLYIARLLVNWLYIARLLVYWLYMLKNNEKRRGTLHSRKHPIAICQTQWKQYTKPTSVTSPSVRSIDVGLHDRLIQQIPWWSGSGLPDEGAESGGVPSSPPWAAGPDDVPSSWPAVFVRINGKNNWCFKS